MTKHHTFWDELLQSFENAVADIRTKVVEEPWYGRAVTAGPGHEPGTQNPSEHEHQPKLEQASLAPDSTMDR